MWKPQNGNFSSCPQKFTNLFRKMYLYLLNSYQLSLLALSNTILLLADMSVLSFVHGTSGEFQL